MSSNGTPTSKKLLRTKQAAEYLSVSPWKLRQLVNLGKLACVQLEPDGPFTFDVRDLDAYAEAHRVVMGR